MSKIIIGFGPYARSGKDYAGQILVEEYGFTRIAFADALKDDLDQFTTERMGISAYTDIPEEKKVIRPLLIAYGCGQRALDPDYWISRLANSQKFKDAENVVITDVRFPNEAQWLTEGCGGTFVFIKSSRESSIKEEQENGPKCWPFARWVVHNTFDESFAQYVRKIASTITDPVQVGRPEGIPEAVNGSAAEGPARLSGTLHSGH